MKINYQIICLVLILCMGYLLLNQGSSSPSAEGTMDTIFARSSVRSYTEEPVDDAVLEELVKAAMAAPTAANMQPWEFIIITNKNTMAEYGKINTFATMATKAPAAILVLANLDVYKARPEMSGYWPQDTSAATQNLLLAAQAKGLGAVWTGIYSENKDYAYERMSKTSALFKLPPNKIPLALVFVGHPDTEPLPKDKWKPEKVSWIK